jgi:hypothetical protein
MVVQDGLMDRLYDSGVFAVERRTRWLLSRVDRWETEMPATVREMLGDPDDCVLPWGLVGDVVRWARQGHGYSRPIRAAPILLLILIHDNCLWIETPHIDCIVDSSLDPRESEDLAEHLRLIDAMLAEGYVPDDAEAELLGLARAALAAGRGEEDGCG